MAEPTEEFVVRPPPRSLRPLVQRYTGYRQDQTSDRLHRGLPSPSLTLIFSFGPPVALAAMPDRTQRPASFMACAGGLHTAPALIAMDRPQHGIQLDLTPLGCRALFGMPAAELASTVVHLDDLLGRQADQLLDRLASAPTWAARFALIDQTLVDAADELRGPSPEVAWTWRQLLASHGQVEIGGLADEVGWSRRHLSERFRHELGLPPKTAARVVRFEHARRLLEQPDHPGLADVAATAGYYDQAHLTRDWRELAGCTPTTWMAEELGARPTPEQLDEPLDEQPDEPLDEPLAESA